MKRFALVERSYGHQTVDGVTGSFVTLLASVATGWRTRILLPMRHHMDLASLRELIDQQAILLPYTVSQYHAMMHQGIIVEGEPYELLHGQVVRKDRSATGEDPMTVCSEHSWSVSELGKLNRKLERHGCHLRTQQHVTIPEYNEPEPDGAIVVGTNDDYRQRHPRAQDTLCAIEVADASLRRDRTTKLQIYADAGISQYIMALLNYSRVHCVKQGENGYSLFL